MLRAVAAGFILTIAFIIVIIVFDIVAQTLDKGITVVEALGLSREEVEEARSFAEAAINVLRVFWWAIPMAVIGTAAVIAIHTRER